MPGPDQKGEQLGPASAGDDPGGSPDPVVVRVPVMIRGGEEQVAGLHDASQLSPQLRFCDVAIRMTQSAGVRRNHTETRRGSRRLKGPALTQLGAAAGMAALAVSDGDEHDVNA